VTRPIKLRLEKDFPARFARRLIVSNNNNPYVVTLPIKEWADLKGNGRRCQAVLQKKIVETTKYTKWQGITKLCWFTRQVNSAAV
jgi:hypothetical protein